MIAMASAGPVSVKTGAHCGECDDPLPGDDREQDQDEADGRGLEHPARPQEPHVDAHQHRDRDGHRDREGAPRAVLERVDDDEREHGDQDDHDREDRDHREEPRPPADLVARHLAERLAVAAQREEQDHEVLHAAAEHDADHDPERARQVAELRGEHRADERTRAGDRGEVVAEDDPAVGRHEVAAVVEPLGRGGARRVEREHLRGDEGRVEAVGDEVGAAAATTKKRPLTGSPRESAMAPSAPAPARATSNQGREETSRRIGAGPSLREVGASITAPPAPCVARPAGTVSPAGP